jgi:hypothetical protein
MKREISFSSSRPFVAMISLPFLSLQGLGVLQKMFVTPFVKNKYGKVALLLFLLISIGWTGLEAQCPTVTFIAIPSPTCTGIDMGQITFSGEAGGLPPYQYSIDNGASYFGAPIFTDLPAGVYDVQIKDADNCESAATAVTVNLLPAQTADAGADWTTCINGSVILDGSIGGGATSSIWDDGGIGGKFLNPNLLSTRYTPPSGYDLPIIIKLSTNGPCQGSDSLVINFAEPADLTLSANGPDKVHCGDFIEVTIKTESGFKDILSLQYSLQWDPTIFKYISNVPESIGGALPAIQTIGTGLGELGYSWFDLAGAYGEDLADSSVLWTITYQVLVSSGAASIVISGVPVSVEATNSQFCFVDVLIQDNTDTISISPLLVTISGDNMLCSGESTTLMATPGVSYLWSTGATTDSITVDPTENTTYTVTVVSTSGCVGTGTQIISVYPYPDPIIAGNITVCHGSSTDLTASGGTSYIWSTGDIVASATVSPLVETTYSVTVSDFGCSATTSATVMVVPLDSVDAGLDQTTCSGGTVHLTGAVAGDSTSGNWSDNGAGGAFSPDANGLDVFYMATDLGPYFLTLTSNGSCPVSDSLVLSIATPTTLVLTAVAPTNAHCGDEITVSVEASSGFINLLSLQYSLNWNPTALQYLSHAAVPIDGTLPVTFPDIPVDQMTYSWSDQSGIEGENLNDGSPLITITFKVISTSISTAVSITDTPTLINGLNSHYCLLNVSPFGASTDISPIEVTCPADYSVCPNAGAFPLTGGLPVGSAYAGDMDFTGDVLDNIFNPSTGQGIHTITYAYTAGVCTNSCEFDITVEDNVAPAIICPNPTNPYAADDNECNATLSFIATAMDNCSATIRYFVGGNEIFFPYDFPAGEITTVTATAMDPSGNSVDGMFEVEVSTCKVDITGKIIWEGDRLSTMSGVNLTTVTLSGTSSDTDITGVPGTYTATGINSLSNNFIITPTKNRPMPHAIMGLTAADGSRILQHVVGVSMVTDPYKIIAADVNISNSITNADESLIQLAVLGNPVSQQWFENHTWRFVDRAYVFSVPSNPWSLGMSPYFPETITLTTGADNQDFIGMKLGDVDNTANPANFNSQIPDLNWQLEDRILEQNSILVAEFKAEHFKELLALQFGLQFDPSIIQFLEFDSIAGSPLQAANVGLYNVDSGDIRVFLSMVAGADLPEGAPAFRIKFKALQGGQKLSEVLHLSNDVLLGTAYSVDYTPGPVDLYYYGLMSGTTELQAGQLQLMQNIPNPFSNQTEIGFVLPESCEARIRVRDVNGRLIVERKEWFAAGHNQVEFQLDGFLGGGILSYELVTPYGIRSRKMLLAR